MQQCQIFLISLAFFVVASSADARSFRVGQIPNGNVNGCANCHINPGGGGARNAFGQAVGAGLIEGNVDWGPALAKLDSDDDGFTNGQELQDPNGAWRPEQAQPGNAALVTKPWDPNSKPQPVTAVEENTGEGTPEAFTLLQNYPNPFNPETQIRFELPKISRVTLQVFNSLGQRVRILVDEHLSPGRYSTKWDGRDDFGRSLSSGVYFYRLDAARFSRTQRMLLLK